MIKMIKVQWDIKINQAIFRLGNKINFFQVNSQNILETGFLSVITRFQFSVSFFYLTLVIVVITACAIWAILVLVHMCWYEQTNNLVRCSTVLFCWLHNWQHGYGFALLGIWDTKLIYNNTKGRLSGTIH
jgi:hypothetical protein